MSQAEAAIRRNAETAEIQTEPRPPQPPRHGSTQTSASTGDAPKRRPWTLKQESLASEFASDYGISRDQIIFFDDSDEPFFLFEALAQIVAELTNFPALHVGSPAVNFEHGLVTCEATITLADNRTFGSAGAAFINETLPGGETLDDYLTATDIARARALRSALRLVGFDPVRAHLSRGREATATRPDPETERRNKELAEIHILAEQAGLIVGDDKSAYYRQLWVFFPGVESAGELGAKERAQFIALLRGVKSAREKAAAAQ
jgi:hypothetical protein